MGMPFWTLGVCLFIPKSPMLYWCLFEIFWVMEHLGLTQVILSWPDLACQPNKYMHDLVDQKVAHKYILCKFISFVFFQNQWLGS